MLYNKKFKVKKIRCSCCSKVINFDSKSKYFRIQSDETHKQLLEAEKILVLPYGLTFYTTAAVNFKQ